MSCKQLLNKFKFRKDTDRLWFVGDLVNRGPKSLEVLRFVRNLGDRAITVLGNHDLHLVSEHEGFERRARATRSTTCSARRTGRSWSTGCARGR